jgi:hypothetical protein
VAEVSDANSLLGWAMFGVCDDVSEFVSEAVFASSGFAAGLFASGAVG